MKVRGNALKDKELQGWIETAPVVEALAEDVAAGGVIGEEAA